MKSSLNATTPKDRGYSWIIMAACFLMYSLMMGTIKTFGILYTELLSTYHGGAGNTASIGSTCTFIQSMMGPLANALSMKYSFRAVTFCGGIFMSSGFFISAFTENMQIMYLSYSVLIGVGYGLTYAPCTTILNFYFQKHRALANGIVLSGSGIGGFIFPFLYNYLIDLYGLHGLMMILSGVMLNSCVAGMLFRQPEESLKQMSIENKAATNGTDPVKRTYGFVQHLQKTCPLLDSVKDIFNFKWQLFKEPSFAFATIAFSLASSGYSSNFIILPAFVESHGFDIRQAAITMSIIGVFEVVSRIFFGWFTDRNIVSARRIFVMSMFVSGVAAFCVPFLSRIEHLYGYAAIVGTFPGSLYTLLPIILIEIVTLEHLPAAIGLTTVVIALMAVIGVPALGWLEDLSGTWSYSYICVGITLLLSAAIVLILDMCSYKAKDNDNNDKLCDKDVIIEGQPLVVCMTDHNV